MSDQTEVTETTNETVAQAETPKNDKPAGYHAVDVATASPEEIQDRLDYLYRQAKTSKRVQSELTTLQTIAADQSKLISELSAGMGQVVNHLQGKEIGETEAELKREMKRSLDSGDTNAYVEAQAKLLEVSARKAAPVTVRSEPKAAPVQQQANDMPQMTAQDQTHVASWMGEKDERGRALRPWTEDDDPDYEAAVAETQAVFKSPRFTNKTMEEKLAEVDRRMGVAKPSTGQTVMGGNLTTRSKSNKITLSPKQQEIAVKTRYGGKSAKSDADHHEAYRKQIEKVQASRGAR